VNRTEFAASVPDLGLPELTAWRRANRGLLADIGEHAHCGHPTFLRTRGSLWLTEGHTILRLPKGAVPPPESQLWRYVDSEGRHREALAKLLPASKPAKVLTLDRAPLKAEDGSDLYAVREWAGYRSRMQARSVRMRYVRAAESLAALSYPDASGFTWRQGDDRNQAVLYVADLAIAAVMGHMTGPGDSRPGAK